MHPNAILPLPQPMAVSYCLHFPPNLWLFLPPYGGWIISNISKKIWSNSQEFCNILTPFCSFLKHFPHLPKWLSLSTFWSSSHFLCFLWELLLVPKPFKVGVYQDFAWTPFSTSPPSKVLPTHMVSYRVRMPPNFYFQVNLCSKFLRALQINYLALTFTVRFHIASVSGDPKQAQSISSQNTNTSSLSFLLTSVVKPLCYSLFLPTCIQWVIEFCQSCLLNTSSTHSLLHLCCFHPNQSI